MHNRRNSLFAQSKNSKYDQDILRLEVWHLIVFIPGTRSTKPSSIVLVTFHTCKRNSVAIKYSSSFWSPSHDKETEPASNPIVLLLFECQQKRRKERNGTRMKSETGFFVIRPKLNAAEMIRRAQVCD